MWSSFSVWAAGMLVFIPHRGGTLETYTILVVGSALRVFFFLSPLSVCLLCSGRVKFNQFALGSQPCGLLKVDKNIIVGCMDGTLNCYSQKVIWKLLSCDPLSSRPCESVCILTGSLCRGGERGVCNYLMSSLPWSSWTTV